MDQNNSHFTGTWGEIPSLHRPDLDVCTVRIEVWSSVGVLRRRQLLGWLALGLNSSSPDAQEHWEQMIQGTGITVTKWHPVHPPE
ncbi:unnamed protein product [Cylicostephanus goldi]|uniref:Uncharacterized protein n=1 Tax=Cylicostephanus goldi TaxID=71465 RepID=A0A3P6QLG8_CYLGO|nr:unnamed protein product [Cylicostephanus goldi]